MNVQFQYQNQINTKYQDLFGGRSAQQEKSGASLFTGMQKRTEDAARMNSLLRGLNETERLPGKAYTANSIYKKNGFLEMSGAPDPENENAVEKKTNYDYKDVSNQIQRAKTSTSAGQAVLKAKRSVLELRRKIANADGDSEELQIALNHAKKIERVAKKKKKNLELEEMIATTQKQDARMEKEQSASGEMRSDLLDAAKENLSAAADEIDAQQQELYEEMSEELRAQMEEEAAEAMEETSDAAEEELLSSLSETLEAIGDEAQEMLEEEMEQLDAMEIVDPHMSKEDFDNLKMKHRSAERKDIVKAEMEYLKDTFAYLEKKNAAAVMPSFSPSIGSPVPAASGAELAMTGFDVSV